MNGFGIAFVACLCLLSGAIIGAGDFSPIINTGIRLEKTRLVLSEGSKTFAEAYRENQQQPRPANYYQPMQMPARQDNCGLVFKKRSGTYGWACGPDVLGVER